MERTDANKIQVDVPMTDSYRLLSGSQHEMDEVEGVYHFRPTVGLVIRGRMGYVKSTVLIAILFLPTFLAAVYLPNFMSVLGCGIAWLLFTLLMVAWVRIRRHPVCHPLIILPSGRIEYRGRLVQAAGPIASVRAYRVNGGDEADTCHVECIADDGKVVVLPRRFFKNCDPGEIMAVVSWIGVALGAAVRDDLRVIAASGYQRRTRRST